MSALKKDPRTRTLSETRPCFDPDGVTEQPSQPLDVELDVDLDVPVAERDWERGLFRLAIEPIGLDRDHAYERLSSAVHHLLTRRLESVPQEVLVRGAGVLRRVGSWALENQYSVSAPYHVGCLARIFSAWHHFRELSKAIDVRNDLLVRMRGRSDDLIRNSVFNEEGRSILVSHARSFIEACTHIGLQVPSLKRGAWIAELIAYRTRDGVWEASPVECLRLCADLLRELGDDAVLHELRGVALTVWVTVQLETNHLRDVFPAVVDEEDDRAALLSEVDERFEALRQPDSADVVYFPGDYSVFERFAHLHGKSRRFVF